MYFHIYILYIGQRPAKNQFMSNESYFTPPQISSVKLKKYKRQTSKTDEHSVIIGLLCSAFSFCEHLNRQFTYAVFSLFKTVICFWMKRFYTNTSLFLLLCLGQLPLWRLFICHYIPLTSQHRFYRTIYPGF